MSPTQSRFADLALVAYLAPILVGRRVGVVGPRSGEVALRARSLGAASVVCFGGVGEDLAVRALVPGAIAGFQGRLDVLVVPDANAVGSLVAVLDEARRALGSEGVVVVASEPPESPRALEPSTGSAPVAYHDLYELCARRFAHVQMLGRGPFAGYLVASLDGDGAAEISLETRLIDGDPPRPEAFIAVAGDRGAALDPLTVVQLPEQIFQRVQESAAAAGEAELGRTRDKLREVEAASAERWVKIQRFEHGLKELEEDNRKQRDRAVRLSKELEDERKLRQRVELDAQMNRRAPELPKGPDPELERLRTALAQRDRDLSALRADLEALEAQRRAAETEAASARTQRSESKALRDAARAELTGLQAELAAARAHAQESAAAHARALAEVRSRLDASAARCAALQAENDGLRRELDETQSSEAELQEQLAGDEAGWASAQREMAALTAAVTAADQALQAERVRHRDELAAHDAAARAERAHLEAEHAGLEHALAARASEILGLRDAVKRGEGALRELLFERSMVREPAVDEGVVVALRAERDAAREALEAAMAQAARASALETELLAQAGEAQQARWQADELGARLVRVEADLLKTREAMVQAVVPSAGAEAALPEGPSDAAGLASLQRELDALESREARLAGALRGMTARAQESEAIVREMENLLAQERRGQEQQRLATHEARNEVSRLYALNLGLEARLVHNTTELEGVRSGAARRVAELETEVDQLLRALQVASTQAASDAREEQEAREVEHQALGATHQGALFRLHEAESALAAVVAASERAQALGAAEAQGSAARLREAEAAVEALSEALAVTRVRSAEALARAEAECASLRSAQAAPRSFLEAADVESGSQARLDQVMSDLTETVSRLAQTEEALGQCQMQVAGLEAALAARDNPGAGLGDEVEALRGECAALRERVEVLREESAGWQGRLHAALGQLDDRDRLVVTLERRLRDEVDALAQMNLALKQGLEQVRGRLSGILVDGRGAMVSHDLLGVLRSIEGLGA